MDFRFPAEVQAFRSEVREFVAREWPRELGRGYFADNYEKERDFRRKLAERGWLAISWPKEYGGSGKSILEQYVFCEDMAYYGAPYAATGINQAGPTVMTYGSEEQKAEFLPQLASGDIDFCLGYTEPGAGTDLASLQLRAVRDGDDYVLNGTKIFTSGAHRSEYCWLAARTDPTAPKHRGISLFMVPMDSPGITVTPIWTIGGYRT